MKLLLGMCDSLHNQGKQEWPGLKERSNQINSGEQKQKGHVIKALLCRMNQLQITSIILSCHPNSGSGREGDCGPAWVTCPCLGRGEEISIIERMPVCLQQGKRHSPTGKPECWAGEITDPHYNNERSPVPSQMSSLVTLQ